MQQKQKENGPIPTTKPSKKQRLGPLFVTGGFSCASVSGEMKKRFFWDERFKKSIFKFIHHGCPISTITRQTTGYI